MIHHRLRNAVLRFFVFVATRHPRRVVAFTIFLAVVSVIYAVLRLQFWTDRNQLVSPEAEYNKLFLALREEFGKQEDVVVAFTGPNPDELIAFAEALDLRLQKYPDLIQHIFYRTDMSVLRTKGLYYLPEESLQKLHQQLIGMTPFVQRFGADPGCNEAFRMACDEIESTIKKGRPGSMAAGFDPGFLTLLSDQAGRSLRQEPLEPFNLEGLFAGDLKGDFRIYNFSEDKKYLFMTVMPNEVSNAFHPMLPCIKALRAELADLATQFPNVEAGVTGSPVLAADEMVDSATDSFHASLLSIAGVTILYILFFGRFTEPIFCTFTLMIGMCWSIGFTTLTIGHLNLLSVAFCSLLIGLGDDFSVHILYRMHEETRDGRSLEEVIRATIFGAGPSLLTSAITTAVAFGMAWFTKFRGIAELGFIAGSGIIFCMIVAMTLLPALFKLRGVPISKPRGLIGIRRDHTPVIDQPAFHPWVVLFGGLAATLIGLYGSPFVDYDDNLLRLQSEGLPAVVWEHRILREAGQSTWYGALMVDTLDEVRQKRAEFEQLKEVSRVDEVTRMLPENQEARRLEIKPLAETVTSWPEPQAKPSPIDAAQLKRNAQQLNFLLGVVASLLEDQPQETMKVPNLDALHRSLNRLLVELEMLPADAAAQALEPCQTAFTEAFNKSLAELRAMVHALPVGPEDIPEPLRSRFVGRTGKFYLRIYPSDDIWESEPRKEFVEALRSVDDRVTGSPLQVHESSKLMRDGYVLAGLYAFIVIVALMFMDFQGLKAVLLAMLPLFAGVAWTLGIMAWTQKPFNLANLLALPLIIGIGVANGIHLVHRFREDGESASLASSPTGRAVILFSLTSMIGFGAMVIASHRGISSLGFVLLVGLGCCLVASLTVLPAILHIASLRKWKV